MIKLIVCKLRLLFWQFGHSIWLPLLLFLKPLSRSYAREKIVLLTHAWMLGGLLILFSSSSVAGQVNMTDPCYYVQRQAIALIFSVGYLSKLVINSEDAFFDRYSRLAFIILTLCLCMTIGQGLVIGGSGRWLLLGNQLIQPSELIKPFLLVESARVFTTWNGLKPRSKVFWGLLYCVILILILIQPNLSTALLCSIVVWMLAWAGHQVDSRVLIYLAILIVLMASFSLLANEYQRIRIISFLNPWQFPHDEGYQLIQSLVAIAGGGMTGLGWGLSDQKILSLPICYTDFIFSIFVEEFGFLGAGVLLFFLWVYWNAGIHLVENIKVSKDKLIALGGLHIFVIQTIFHIGVCLGLLPTTGLPFPFISYGINAIICNGIIAGLIFRASYNQ